MRGKRRGRRRRGRRRRERRRRLQGNGLVTMRATIQVTLCKCAVNAHLKSHHISLYIFAHLTFEHQLVLGQKPANVDINVRTT